MAPVRMAFSFSMGLWLYRVRERAPKFRLGWGVLSAVLIVAFALPLVPRTVPHGNGLYEAAVAMALFPAIILCGAHSEIGRAEMALCKFAGRISYPLYILHYPFLLVFMNFVVFRKPPVLVADLAAAGSFVLVLAVAWLALKLYDEPVRRRLKLPRPSRTMVPNP
jgi:peptidoglycan/LPS O-acetylase OafA/YrhL